MGIPIIGGNGTRQTYHGDYLLLGFSGPLLPNVSGCNGAVSPDGTVYKTGPITADCTVTLYPGAANNPAGHRTL